MARRKVRNFKSKKYYEDVFSRYFDEHIVDVKRDLMERLGYSNFGDIWEDEYNMKWGFDCGWVLLYPRGKEMRREWQLDNGKYGDYIFAHPSYNCQSTTLQRIQVEKALADLELTDTFYAVTRLD